MAVLKATSSDYAIDSCCQLHMPSGGGEGANEGGAAITSPVNAVKWSPHRNASTIGVAFDSGILGIDTRCMK